MKKIVSFVLALFLAGAYFSGPVNVFAKQENPKQDFAKVGTAPVYNWLDYTLSQENDASARRAYDEKLGDVIEVAVPETASGRYAPILAKYSMNTTPANASYYAYMYKYTGDDTQSSMLYVFYNNSNKPREYSEIYGDGEWRIGVFDFSDEVPVATTNVSAMAFTYVHSSDMVLKKTPFYLANANIFKNNPMISELDFNITPVIGKKPKSASDVEHDGNFTINYIDWSDENGSDFEVFEMGHTYTANISVTADENYVICDKKLNFAGAEAISNVEFSDYLYGNTVQFSCAYNTENLKITPVSVKDGDTDVSNINTRLEFSFSKAVDVSSLLGENAVSVEPDTAFHMEMNDKTNAALVFDEDLLTETEYTVRFSDSIYSEGGIPADAYSMRFITGTYPDPKVTATLPKDGDKNISVQSHVRVDFDMDMDISTMSMDNITVSPAVKYEIIPDEKGFSVFFENGLDYNTKYTVIVSDGVKSKYDTGSLYSFEFTTIQEFKNLINNGYIEDTNDKSMFIDGANGGNISYVTVDDINALKFNVGWTNAVVVSNFDASAGHTYFTHIRIKSDTDQNVLFSFYYNTESGANPYHSVGEVTVKKDKWTDVYAAHTVASNALPDDCSLRFVARTANTKIHIAQWELFDKTIAPSGDGKMTEISPENNASEVNPYGTNIVLNFDKPINPQTVISSLSITPQVSSKIIFSRDLLSCTIVPESLSVNTTYSVSAGSGMKTMHGDSISSETFRFSTYTLNDVPMNVVETTPADGSENVSADNLIMNIVFDSYPDVLTIGGIRASEDIISSVEIDRINPKQVNVAFDGSKMAMDKTYSVTVPSDVKSMIGNGTTEKTVTFSTKTGQFVLEKFNACAAEDEIKSFMDNHFSDVIAGNEMYKYLLENNTDVTRKIYSMLKNEKKPSTVDELKALLDEAVMNACLAYGNDENITYFISSKALGIAGEEVYEVYSDFLDNNGKSSLIKRLSGQTYGDVRNKVAEQIVLEALKHSNGYTNVKNILGKSNALFNKMNSDISSLMNNISSKKLDSVIYNQLQGYDADTLSGVKSKLQGLYDAHTEKPAAAGGGGSSGGSSGRASGSLAVTGGQVTSEEKTDVIFTDLDGYPWAKKYIEDFYSRGIVSGRGNKLFEPGAYVLREEFVKMVLLAADINIDKVKCSYSDVSENEWYYPYVATLSSKGIINGIGNDKFGTGERITRQDMAVIIYNIIKPEINEETAAVPFDDNSDISGYAVEAVEYLQSMGIVKGDDNSRFNPKANATRAEAVSMLYRMREL